MSASAVSTPRSTYQRRVSVRASPVHHGAHGTKTLIATAGGVAGNGNSS